ncbi:tyrosine-type recombinase/integrase [Rhizobium laguerreae]|uniref:tyrosine-type recombinase/integrase n=1 Tax=Rhizobium laguerreae TaxID=1076926 RepID=UPI001C908E54|nr:site-specific integrase [Rhizobium laguerreae]MBY3420342.1 tyrosine-type recombinase/integrase [Rhizobium laguerreae]
MPKSLTVKFIEALKNPATRAEIPDGLTVGLYLIVQPSGRKSWAVRYRFQGKSRKYTLGAYPALSLSFARDLARSLLTAVAEGKDPSRGPVQGDGPTTVVTVSQALEDFFKRYVTANNRSSTARETRRLLEKELGAPLGDRDIVSIVRSDITDQLDEISDRGAHIGANRTLAAMRRFFNWCVERDYVHASPCDRLKAPSVEKTRERVLADDEIALIWEASERIGWPFGQFVKLLLLTGQRRSEVAGMRRQELDWNRSLWTIPAPRSKNLQPHEVPLSVSAREVLASIHPVDSDEGLIFSTTGKSPISGYSKAKKRVDNAIQAILKERDGRNEAYCLPSWAFHDLRRTVATGMARAGVAQQVIEKVLNHTSGSLAGVAGIYNRHAFNSEKREALELWSQHVVNLVAKPHVPLTL